MTHKLNEENSNVQITSMLKKQTTSFQVLEFQFPQFFNTEVYIIRFYVSWMINSLKIQEITDHQIH